ncbi:MAG TPA: hypothetical protein DD730_01065 [Desulfosporosinus sp.]|nr:hypothetical protein [Desulfosporosinus sp.]
MLDATLIRKYVRKDEIDVLNICYETGFSGESLKSAQLFNDKKLFGYLFCSYYLHFEIENCFVAEDVLNNKLLGYIIGTMDTPKQERLFGLKMFWRIGVRLLSYTWWRHPETIKSILYFVKHAEKNNVPKNLSSEYPAHFHINIISEKQHSGIGSSLLKEFEKHAISHNIHGIHLETTNIHTKAIPFYLKNGYKILYENTRTLWKTIDDSKTILLGKKL